MNEEIETVNVTEQKPVDVTEQDKQQDSPEQSGPTMFDELESEAGELQTEQKPEDQSKIPTASIAAGAFHTTFNLLAPAWQISQQECGALGEAWAPILDKYLPGILDNIFGAAIATTMIVVGPRLGHPMKHKPKPNPKQQAQGDKPTPQQVTSDGGASSYGY